MRKLILPKNKLNELLEKALKSYQVVAPTENDGMILFNRITNPSEIILEYINTKMSPKDILFKQTEMLFKFLRSASPEIESPNNTGEKVIIFGIRPCDVKSFSILDHVFKDDYEDPYYNEKREDAILIGLSCNEPGVNCFCTSLYWGPSSQEGMDILLTDIGDDYFVEVVSEKGEKFVESMGKLFKPATESDEKKREEIAKKAIEAFTRHADVNGIEKKLENMFDSDLWQKIAIKCLGCGECTYVCPTCHCFDIQDETTTTEGARVRVWDSCMFPEYTLHASGHNPRPARMNRMRNRIYHKYNYFPKNHDVIACVGCGRCVDVCPVNIDIIDILNKIKEVKA